MVLKAVESYVLKRHSKIYEMSCINNRSLWSRLCSGRVSADVSGFVNIYIYSSFSPLPFAFSLVLSLFILLFLFIFFSISYCYSIYMIFFYIHLYRPGPPFALPFLCYLFLLFLSFSSTFFIGFTFRLLSSLLTFSLLLLSPLSLHPSLFILDYLPVYPLSFLFSLISLSSLVLPPSLLFYSLILLPFFIISFSPSLFPSFIILPSFTSSVTPKERRS